MSAVSSRLKRSRAPGIDSPGRRADFAELYRLLRKYYHFDPSWPEGDWPRQRGFSPEWLEVVIGAVLTQNTRWENVELSLRQLNDEGLVNLASLVESSDEELQRSIRSSGFYRQKSATLQHLCRLFLSLNGEPPSRESLLSIRGIGPETADSILLYAFGIPEFVVDNYTRRFLERMDLIEARTGYGDLKTAFESQLQPDVSLFRAYHALIVQHGKNCCRRRPDCSRCPFSGDCPRRGVEGNSFGAGASP